MAQRTLTFSNGVIVNVAVMGNGNSYLPVDFNGGSSLIIPGNIVPRTFLMTVLVPVELRPILTQRDLSREEGDYHNKFIKSLGNILNYRMAVLPIQVTRMGRNTWTSWKEENPNNLDIWLCGPGNSVEMFKVGLVTHDDGQTYRVIGETRWAGGLFRDAGKIVGKPNNSVWGAFRVRDNILDHQEFKIFLSKTQIPAWKGKPEELNPPLTEVPEGNYGVVKFNHPMMGQKGQALIVLAGGKEAWLFLNNLDKSPDADGVKRLQRGDVIAYQAIKQSPEGKLLILNATKV
jgi:hypothetical protein